MHGLRWHGLTSVDISSVMLVTQSRNACDVLGWPNCTWCGVGCGVLMVKLCACHLVRGGVESGNACGTGNLVVAAGRKRHRRESTRRIAKKKIGKKKNRCSGCGVLGWREEETKAGLSNRSKSHSLDSVIVVREVCFDLGLLFGLLFRARRAAWRRRSFSSLTCRRYSF